LQCEKNETTVEQIGYSTFDKLEAWK